MVEQIEKDAISRIEQMLPRLFDDYRELTANAVNDMDANDIAAAQEDGEDAQHEH